MGAKGWDLDPPSATFPEKKNDYNVLFLLD